MTVYAHFYIKGELIIRLAIHYLETTLYKRQFLELFRFKQTLSLEQLYDNHRELTGFPNIMKQVGLAGRRSLPTSSSSRLSTKASI